MEQDESEFIIWQIHLLFIRIFLFCLIIVVSTDFDMEFKRSLGRGASIVEMRQELRAFTVAFWMKVAPEQLDPGTPISYAVQEGGTLLKYLKTYFWNENWYRLGGIEGREILRRPP